MDAEMPAKWKAFSMYWTEVS